MTRTNENKHMHGQTAATT